MPSKEREILAKPQSIKFKINILCKEPF
jgi:hypothetical protein